MSITFVTFDKSQPDNVKFLTSFAKQLHGNYLADDMSAVITVTDKLITFRSEYDIKEHKDSIVFINILVDTTLDLKSGKEKNLLLQGDTMVYHVDRLDTIFNISEDNVLKKLKGNYFLNFRYEDNTWEVIKLGHQRDTLTLSFISIEDEIQKLKEISGSAADSESKNFTLTRRQFKKFIKQDGFSLQETFIRVMENTK